MTGVQTCALPILGVFSCCRSRWKPPRTGKRRGEEAITAPSRRLNFRAAREPTRRQWRQLVGRRAAVFLRVQKSFPAISGVFRDYFVLINVIFIYLFCICIVDVKEKEKKRKEKKWNEMKIVNVCVCILFYLFLYIFNDKIANILKKNLIFWSDRG